MVTYLIGAQRWTTCLRHGSWRIPQQLDEAVDHFTRLHGIPSHVPEWLGR